MVPSLVETNGGIRAWKSDTTVHVLSSVDSWQMSSTAVRRMRRPLSGDIQPLQAASQGIAIGRSFVMPLSLVRAHRSQRQTFAGKAFIVSVRVTENPVNDMEDDG